MHYFQGSREHRPPLGASACNYIVSRLILAKLDIVRDGIPSLICNVLCMKHSVADKSVVSGPISPKL